MSRPEWRALTTLFGEILTGRSTLVSDLSLPLREGPGASERNAVVRVKKMDRDVFGDGRTVDESMKSAEFFDVTLSVRTGNRGAKVRHRPGVVQYCADPKSKSAATENVALRPTGDGGGKRAAAPKPAPAGREGPEVKPRTGGRGRARRKCA